MPTSLRRALGRLIEVAGLAAVGFALALGIYAEARMQVELEIGLAGVFLFTLGYLLEKDART